MKLRARLRLACASLALSALVAGCGTKSEETRPPAMSVADIPAQVYSQGKSQTVYFNTGQSELDDGDMTGLSAFVQENGPQHVLIEGHCDERGSAEYNQLLGEQRAGSVKSYLESQGIKNITTVSYGERRPVEQGHTERSFARNRRATVLTDTNIVWRGLDSAPADAYIIDGSGSMRATLDNIIFHEEPLQGALKVRNDSRWGMVAVYPFPEEADVYVFAWDRLGVRKLDDPKQYFPHGETPLWIATEWILKTHDYSRITVLTDGDNNIDCTGGTPYWCASKDSVIVAANAKGTSVSTIGIGVVSENTKWDLMEVARQTGGSHYIQESLHIDRPGLELHPWSER
jgi:peptidoglycan-associated lipoprotein